LSEHHNKLLQIYRLALEAVNGRRCTLEMMESLSLPSPVYAVAIGKAAADMMLGACDALGTSLAGGLVITRRGYLPADFDDNVLIQGIESGHPVPDAASLEAGAAVLDFVRSAPRAAPLLFLISGGASSLVEVLPGGMTLADLQRLNDWLLASGLAIDAVNQVRKSVSSIKGGRLALQLGGRTATVLLISDVPGDDVAVIGSGLLAPGRAPTPAASGLPGWVTALQQLAPPLPPPDHPAFAGISHHVIATLAMARQAAANAGRQLGYAATLHDDFVAGDAVRAGRRIAAELGAGTRGLHVWGGEVTVTLPSAPGRGGRCQQLALAAAIELDGRDDLLLLAGGTDGSDGPGNDAGALVHGGTLARGRAAGLDAGVCLARADAGSYLAVSGGLLETGPTGTNVMDLYLGIRS
jgi:hydroxypyruvate reductase